MRTEPSAVKLTGKKTLSETDGQAGIDAERQVRLSRNKVDRLAGARL